MTKFEEFNCRRLNRTMTAGKCLRLQEEARDFFGADKAGKCTTCPCPQGERIRGEIMRKKKDKRTCRNCGRMMTIAQDNLCGGCFTRTKGLTGEKLAEEMEKAARDFGGYAKIVAQIRRRIAETGVTVKARPVNGRRNLWEYRLATDLSPKFYSGRPAAACREVAGANPG